MRKATPSNFGNSVYDGLTASATWHVVRPWYDVMQSCLTINLNQVCSAFWTEYFSSAEVQRYQAKLTLISK